MSHIILQNTPTNQPIDNKTDSKSISFLSIYMKRLKQATYIPHYNEKTLFLLTPLQPIPHPHSFGAYFFFFFNVRFSYWISYVNKSPECTWRNEKNWSSVADI